MATHGGVYTHRRQVRYISPHRLVEGFAHAVQALKLILRPRRSKADHRCDRERVVRCELRIDDIRRCKEPLCTHQVASIGSCLGGVDGEARQPALLRSLDLAVPVSPFDEPHGHAPPAIARQRGYPLDHPR